MSAFHGGPADGQTLMLGRAPLYLRIVVDEAGKVDALDQLDDTADLGETIHVYRREGDPMVARLCSRRPRRSESYEIGEYVHLPTVEGEQFRDNAVWRAWASAQPREEEQGVSTG